MQILDRAPSNGSGTKAAKPAEESDNPFNEARGESAEQDIP
jgi:hypothetical protein